MLHANALAGDNHVVQNWEVADAPTRLALGTVGTDVGKICKQIDTAEFWILTSTGWKSITSASVVANNSSSALAKAIALQNKLRAVVSSPSPAIHSFKNF